MKVDLHIHSYLSDGRYSPSRIVEYSVQNKLEIISLTDHDTIAGLQEARRAVQLSGTVNFLTGVELSTYMDDDELHILGYGIDDMSPVMMRFLTHAQTSRKKRVGRILERLQEVGIRLTMNEVQNGYGSVSLGRMHIARLLIKRGYVRTVREAFDRYLSYETNLIEHPFTDFVSSQEAIAMILDAGGIPVLAHPTIALFDQHIDTLIESGLQGVEVFKGTRTAIEEFYLETVVKDKGLFMTGGSDWHGYHRTLNLGNFYVESERIQPFLEAVDLL